MRCSPLSSGMHRSGETLARRRVIGLGSGAAGGVGALGGGVTSSAGWYCCTLSLGELCQSGAGATVANVVPPSKPPRQRTNNNAQIQNSRAVATAAAGTRKRDADADIVDSVQGVTGDGGVFGGVDGASVSASSRRPDASTSPEIGGPLHSNGAPRMHSDALKM